MLEQIKQRVSIRDLFDVLGVRVRGRLASCPLHQDTHPSMSFKDTGLWYCFVCGVGGDITNLVMKTQGLTFKESLHWLNDKFSLGLTNKTPKRNYYLEALNENYKALKESLQQEFNDNCQRHYTLMDTIRELHYPYLFWTRDDFTFELTYDNRQDYIEQKLKELEDVRHRLRANSTSEIRVDS